MKRRFIKILKKYGINNYIYDTWKESGNMNFQVQFYHNNQWHMFADGYWIGDKRAKEEEIFNSFDDWVGIIKDGGNLSIMPAFARISFSRT